MGRDLTGIDVGGVETVALTASAFAAALGGAGATGAGAVGLRPARLWSISEMKMEPMDARVARVSAWLGPRRLTCRTEVSGFVVTDRRFRSCCGESVRWRSVIVRWATTLLRSRSVMVWVKG